MATIPQPAGDALDNALKAAGDLATLWRSGGTLSQAMGITDRECEALYTVGHAYYQQGKYAEAYKAFAYLVSINHLDDRYQASTGSAAQMLGRYEDALHYYMAVTLMRLDDPVPVYHSAECLMALGKLREAAESLELALEIGHKNEEKHAGLISRAQTMLAAIKSRMNK